MISILTYVILTYISFKFIIWLFNINLDDNSNREFEPVIIKEYKLKNQKIFKNININKFRPNPRLKDQKLYHLFYRTIYKNHIQVCVNN